MTAIRRFEEVKAWQKARQLTNAVYTVTQNGDFARDFGLRDQIRRAAGSVMHNIAEGFDSGTDAEFRRFLRISVRSATEVQSQLYLAFDLAYLSKEQFDNLYEQAETTKAFIRKFIAYLSSTKTKAVREEQAVYFAGADGKQKEDVGRRT